jgi:hypothetical protein
MLNDVEQGRDMLVLSKVQDAANAKPLPLKLRKGKEYEKS